MTKVLFILSAVVMLVACFFAWENGRRFAETRNEVAEAGRNISASTTAMAKLKNEAAAEQQKIAQIQEADDAETEKLKAHKNRLAQAEADTVRTQEEFDVKSAEQKKLADQLDSLPKDVKVETLAEDINRLKKEKLDFEGQAEEVKKKVAAEEEKVAGIQKRVDDVVRKIEERSRNFERNSLNARILAVNHEWGFVVIDAGKSTGLTEETKLIVTRGAQTVGKVSVSTIENGRAMANILPNTVANGEIIMPGDRVILENLVQN